MARLTEGVDKDSGRSRGRENVGVNKILQEVVPQQKTDFGDFLAHNPTLVGTRYSNTEHPDNYLRMEYEVHLGTKNDHLFFQSSQLFQATEILLLQNQCEQKRIHIPTKIILVLENPRPAGCALTGNRSTFL